jgi:hypothetical protein
MRSVISPMCLTVYFSGVFGVILSLKAEPSCDGSKRDQQKEKSPSGELGGLSWGFPIFETKTHPATVNITVGRRNRFLQSPKRSRTTT